MNGEEAIERFFLQNNGVWELTVIPEGHPTCIPGRWLDCSDSNYSFRPVDLLKAIQEAASAKGE